MCLHPVKRCLYLGYPAAPNPLTTLRRSCFSVREMLASVGMWEVGIVPEFQNVEHWWRENSYVFQAGGVLLVAFVSEAFFELTRRFWEIDPEIVHTCLLFPYRTVDEFFFFSPAVFFFFVFFWVFWFFGILHFLQKKNKNVRTGLGRGTFITCKISGCIHLSRTAWTFRLMRETCKNHGFSL